MPAAVRSSVLAIWMRLGSAVMERNRHCGPSATPASRPGYRRRSGFAFCPSAAWRVRVRALRRRQPRALAISDVAGSYFGRQRHGGFAFRPYDDSGFASCPSAASRVRILSIGGFPGSGFVHSRIPGSDIVHLEPFLALRWTKDEPRIGGWPKSEPEIGGWSKSEPNMPCREGWSTLMDKRRTQHARSGGLERVDGRTSNPGYDDWARCGHGLRRWQRNEPGDGAAVQSAACGGNGPS